MSGSSVEPPCTPVGWLSSSDGAGRFRDVESIELELSWVPEMRDVIVREVCMLMQRVGCCLEAQSAHGECGGGASVTGARHRHRTCRPQWTRRSDGFGYSPPWLLLCFSCTLLALSGHSPRSGSRRTPWLVLARLASTAMGG